LEEILEGLLRQYSNFREQYDKLSTLQAFRSGCIIVILPSKDDCIKRSYIPFGILQKNMMKGRIETMERSLAKLKAFDRDFISLRYFELQSRDFVMQYLKIPSISTYKRVRHRTLLKYYFYLIQDPGFDLYFWDYMHLKSKLIQAFSEQYPIKGVKQ
jgi:hypothetical protein